MPDPIPPASGNLDTQPETSTSLNRKGNPMRRWFVILSIMTAVVTASAQTADTSQSNNQVPTDAVCPGVRNLVNAHNYVPAQDPGDELEVNENTDLILESLGTKGEEIEGQKRIVLQYINRLRYSFAISIDVTNLPNPTLPQAFLAPKLADTTSEITKSTARETTQEQRPVIPAEFEDTFLLIQQCNNAFEEKLAEIQKEASTIKDTIEKAKSAYQATLSRYPAVLSFDQAEKLQRSVANDVGVLTKAIEKPYPSDFARAVVAALDSYLKLLTLLEGTQGFAVWKAKEGGKNGDRYLFEKQRPQSVKDRLTPYSPGSDAEKKARAEQEQIAFWQPLFDVFSRYTIRKAVLDDKGDPISGRFQGHLFLPVLTNCHTVFGKGKQSKISYTITDLYGTSNQVVSGVVTSVCPPLLTVSAGVGFSTLGTHTPGIIPTSIATTTGGDTVTTVENKIGYTEKSALKPVYVVQMNAHIATLGKSWSAHGTLGAAAVNREDSTNLEWLFGLSLAYKRAIFLTPAFHLGRQTSIAGGFSEGQTKPATGLDAVPTTTDWKPGFAFTITYPLNK